MDEQDNNQAEQGGTGKDNVLGSLVTYTYCISIVVRMPSINSVNDVSLRI